MGSNNIKYIFLKELLGAIRDRRTMMTMILVPLVFYPILFGGMAYLFEAGEKRSEEEISRVVMVGSEYAPTLEDRLDKLENVKVVHLADYESELDRGGIQAILLIPRDFEKTISAGGSAQVSLQIDEAEMKSAVAKGRIEASLRDYEKEIVRKRLADRNLEEGILDPIDTKIVNVASAEKMGGAMLSALLPYLIIILIFTGAMIAAMDITAGEKERGTIATLLVSQVTRLQIVLGKFFTVLVISLITMILGLVGLMISFSSKYSFVRDVPGVALGISFETILLVFAVLLPLSALISAILIIIGTFARSIREAQSYATPLYMVTIFLGIVSMSQGLELGDWVYLVPILSTSFTMKEILMGDINWLHFGFTLASSLVIAGLSIIGAAYMFTKETVLFRSS